MEKNGKTTPIAASKFSKEKILKSAVYKDKIDLVSALLEDGKEYTKDEVAKLISGYEKREVSPRYRTKKKNGGDR